MSSLLLLIIGAIVLIYLSFKFIKKIIWLVLSIILILILMFVSVFGLIYFDLKDLSEQKDVDLNVVYVQEDSSEFGAKILMKSGEIDEESLSGLEKKEISNLEEKNLDPDDGTYVVYVNDEIFNNLLDDEVFSISEMLDDPMYEDYILELTGAEVKKIISVEDSLGETLNILFEKNDINGFEREIAEPLIRSEIEKALEELDLNIKEALFLLVLQNSATKQDKILTIVEGYKDGTIIIEPQRLTFTLIKWLPAGFILDFFENNLAK